MTTGGELPAAEVIRLTDERARRPMGSSRAAPSGESGRWMTRNEVALALGVSKTTVRRMEEARILQPVKDRGVHRFERSAVEATAAARGRGVEAAAGSRPEAVPVDSTSERLCFTELARGTPLREIARTHGIAAAQVETAARAWSRLARLEGEVVGANLSDRLDDLEVARLESEPQLAWLTRRVAALEELVAQLGYLPPGAMGVP